jgi:hypothetical protein
MINRLSAISAFAPPGSHELGNNGHQVDKEYQQIFHGGAVLGNELYRTNPSMPLYLD